MRKHNRPSPRPGGLRSGMPQCTCSLESVCERVSQLTSDRSILFLLWEWIHPLIDQQFSHADPEHMTPETLYVNQTSSLNRGRCIGRWHLQGMFRLLEEAWAFRGESTMSVVLDLVIKTILYTRCCQLRLRLCQYVYQERLWITLSPTWRPQHPQTSHTVTSSCSNPCPPEPYQGNQDRWHQKIWVD